MHVPFLDDGLDGSVVHGGLQCEWGAGSGAVAAGPTPLVLLARVPELLQQGEDIDKFLPAAVPLDHGFVWSCELVDQFVQ
ncbi:hypothetical protein GCM10011577_01460 [Pseudarthrobacter polychromogenes]|uniref:Uncharacterized protein n=1 Tax=Pseudarthrobacter polychromogenes TaxID=1676 RepID=A0ABQ1XBU1_9MICC|nr:hypothetical protein GCM10011577_01460 [Pseudarthrobacter polychromogenes]